MIIKNKNKAKIKETLHGLDIRPLYNKETAQAIHITLNPGESLKPHITPVDVFFYILEGKPTVLVGKEEEEVDKDHLVESPAHVVHCLSNRTENTARVLVVKAPRPVSKSKIL